MFLLNWWGFWLIVTSFWETEVLGSVAKLRQYYHTVFFESNLQMGNSISTGLHNKTLLQNPQNIFEILYVAKLRTEC